MFSNLSFALKPIVNAFWPSITWISWNLALPFIGNLYDPDQNHSPPTQHSSPHAFNTITGSFQNTYFTCPWVPPCFQIAWLVSPHLPDLYSLKYSRASLFIYNHSWGYLIHFCGSRYHLHTDDSQICSSRTNIYLELQTYTTVLLNILIWMAESYDKPNMPEITAPYVPSPS